MITQIRKLFIEIATRRQKPRTGTDINFFRTRNTNMKWIALIHILSPIKCAVIGAVATGHYMPEKVTKDIDIVESSKLRILG